MVYKLSFIFPLFHSPSLPFFYNIFLCLRLAHFITLQWQPCHFIINSIAELCNWLVATMIVFWHTCEPSVTSNVLLAIQPRDSFDVFSFIQCQLFIQLINICYRSLIYWIYDMVYNMIWPFSHFRSQHQNKYKCMFYIIIPYIFFYLFSISHR